MSDAETGWLCSAQDEPIAGFWLKAKRATDASPELTDGLEAAGDMGV